MYGPDRPDKSPELNLFAQLCGVQQVKTNILDVYNALRACIDMGEKGWLVSIALLNIVLGGNVAVPDVVSVIPPGYGKYLKKISLVNEVVLEELLPDIPFPERQVFHRRTEDREGTFVDITVERYPKAFGVYIEYEYPDFASGGVVVNKELWVIYQASTGSYLFKSFLAPTAVAERVSKILEETGMKHYEKPLTSILDEAQQYLKNYSYSELRELVKKGVIRLPEGVKIELSEEKKRPRPF